VTFPSNSSPTEEQIDEACNNSIDYLKSRVSYCFTDGKNPVIERVLSTWANRLSRSSIEKKGTASDKEKLPPLTNRNTAKGSNKRVRKEKPNPLYLNRQQKRRKIACNNNSTGADLETRRTGTATVNDNNVNAFTRAFGHVQTPAALRREAQEFSAQAQRTAEARRQETGDVGGNDGDSIFINQGSATQTQMAPNHGHTSRIEREQFGRDLEDSMNNQNSNERLVGPQQNQVG